MSAARLPLPEPKRALAILRQILVQPTAPFHEHRVRGTLCAVLDRAGVRWKIDAYGNLLASYRKGRARPMAMTAHMDHPGLKIPSVRRGTAEARRLRSSARL